MSQNSKIEWTDATWNPVTGCTKVSPGCAHSYAERITERFHGPGSFEKVVCHPDRLGIPLHWRHPRRVFVNSMSDLFHEDIPIEFIARVFNVMACATVDCGKRHKHEEECWTGDPHIFQVLTKRPQRMREVLKALPEFCSENLSGDSAINLSFEVGNGWPLPNVWLGVSCENQHFADERIPLLLATPAVVRFVSCEPLLGPIDLTARRCFLSLSDPKRNGVLTGSDRFLNWVIVGGESGPGARPMHPEWARSLRDQCIASGVPFFFKQWGEWAPRKSGRYIRGPVPEYRVPNENGMMRVGKRAAGRLLDGQEWSEYPRENP